MKNLQIALAASMAMGSVLMPMSAMAQHPKPKHHKLATAAVGIAAYEAAKHSHNKFAKKHRFAAGIAAAIAANKMMKAHDKHVLLHPKHHH